MRKFAFLLGLVVMTTSLAFAQSNYTAESDGTYTYTGSPVDELSIDFTTWAIADLPSALTDDMAAAESHNMAFVKWKVASRKIGDVYMNALHNNNAKDFGDSPANNATTNPPRIYLPTTSGSVTNIKIYAGGANAYMYVYYKDDDHATWTQADNSKRIPTSSAYAYYESALNSNGPTSIYIQYTGTSWPSITSLELTIDVPEESVYTYDSGTGYYNYTGDPVDELSVDFTTWQTTDLPTPLSDNMTLVQKDGLGFVKWKIASRNCGGEKGTVNALHNDNNTDFPSGPNNSSTTNKPRIYLPTTSTGVRSIKVHGMGNVKLGVRYMDATHSSWTWADYIILPSSYGEASLALNTSGKTSICIENAQTNWPTITDLIVETKYILNSETGKYDYMGEPVDEINVDFTSWFAGYLPSTLSDDMPLAEMNNLGFVKWKMDHSNNTYTLFNNNANDFGGSPTNSDTEHKPTIYFPTTVRGVESIAITYTAGNDFQMNGTYTDAIQTQSENIALPKATTPNTVVWNLNSAGETKVNLRHFSAVWPRIYSIVFTIKDTEATPLVLWAKTDSHGNGNRIIEANGETRDVYLKRDFTADGYYYTLCLPFDLTAEQVTAAFGSCTLAKLTSSALNGGEIELNFDDVTTIEAGVPYLFLPAADIASCFFPAVTINAEASRVINTTYFKMTGIYNPTVLTSEDYFMNNDNYLVQVTDENPLKPFRAYFTIVENSGANNAPARVVFSHNQATAIGNINAKAPVEKTIENGQIVIIKDGVRYNVLGTQIAK